MGVPLPERSPVDLAELAEVLVQDGGLLPGDHVLVVRPTRGDRHACRVQRRGRPLTSDVVDGDVGRDRLEPGTEAGCIVDLVQPGPCAQEGLLHHVLGRVLVTQSRHRHGADPSGVVATDGLPRTRIAVDRGVHETCSGRGAGVRARRECGQPWLPGPGSVPGRGLPPGSGTTTSRVLTQNRSDGGS